MALLEIKNVTSGYSEVQILWGVDMALEQGKLTSLVGANGAGKTTLLKTVMGLMKPWDGQVIFDGQDVSMLPAHEKAELGLVLVPEGRQLLPICLFWRILKWVHLPNAPGRTSRKTLKLFLRCSLD